MTDQLSPEDRALYDAFFKAYGAKHAELSASAAPGAEISLDACTVHAIKSIAPIEPEVWGDAIWHALDELSDDLLELQDLSPLEDSRDFARAHERKVFGRAADILIDLMIRKRPAPRIVSAVGVGVKVRPPEERASLLDRAVEAAKAAPAGRRAEAIRDVFEGEKFEAPKLSAEGLETVRAARQAYGVCEWWDEITSQAGELRRFKSSTCGAPEWPEAGAVYRKMPLEKWIERFGRCQCGRVVVIRGEDELAEGGA